MNVTDASLWRRLTPVLCLLVLMPAGSAVASVSIAGSLADAVGNSPDRNDDDKARDAGRKPDQVLAYLGLERGDTALDIWSSGGWYTEVLSIAVGEHGHVYSQNGPSVLQFRDGLFDKLLTERLAGDRLANVTRLDEAMADTSIAADSIDVAITALNFHDVYNKEEGAEAAVAMLEAIHGVLKPGGTLGLIDHVGVADANNADLHRMDQALAEDAARIAGFTVETNNELLAGPDDDHTQKVFDPSVRGKTDRFILKLRKPE